MRCEEKKKKKNYGMEEKDPPPHCMSPNGWYEGWRRVTLQAGEHRLDGIKGLSIFYELECWR